MLVFLHGYVVSRVNRDLPANIGAIYNRLTSVMESQPFEGLPLK